MKLIFPQVATAAILTLSATPQANLRELCRQRVAGQYLSIFDRAERAKQLLTLTKSKLGEMQLALKSEEARRDRITAELRDSPFDPNIASRATQAEASVRQILAALSDQQKLAKDAAADLAAVARSEGELKKRLGELFKFENVEVSSGYKFRLAYKRDCPKIRHSCPLDPDEKDALLKIFDGGEVPEVCTRYSGMSSLLPR
jgi:hypothetical protein